MHVLSEFLTLMVFIKMGTAVLMVVGLSVLAELVSPRFAGLISGYPLGSALSLFFMGYEISPDFAAESARHTSMGLIATQFFAYFYYRASLLALGLNKGLQVLCAAFGGLCGYFLSASLLSPLNVGLVTAVVVPSIFILLFIHLFRGVENAVIEKRAPLGLKALLFRAAFAAAAIAVITTIARSVGSGWAGLFAAFPITMLPFLVILQLTYEPEHVYAVLKNVPKGLGSLVMYALAVTITYPVYGIYIGTAIAYTLATLYLAVSQFILRPRTSPLKQPSSQLKTEELPAP